MDVIGIRSQEILESYSRLMAGGISLPLEQYIAVRNQAMLEFNKGFMPPQEAAIMRNTAIIDNANEEKVVRRQAGNDQTSKREQPAVNTVIKNTSAPVALMGADVTRHAGLAGHSGSLDNNSEDEDIQIKDDFAILRSIKDTWN